MRTYLKITIKMFLIFLMPIFVYNQNLETQTLVKSIDPAPRSAQTQEGEVLFNQTCQACHTINRGKLVGPDLVNIHNKYSRAWLIKFIRSSQKLIQSGDEAANKSFEENFKIIMPDNDLSDDQIFNIIQYIAISSELDSNEVNPELQLQELRFTEKEILIGEQMFFGLNRFTNRGPSCNSCHNIDNSKFFTGGGFATDLTKTIFRLSYVGVQAILKDPSFPAMKIAYQNKPLIDQEVSNLSAYLNQVNENVDKTQIRINYATIMVVSGLAGVLLLLIFFTAIWSSGKHNSVNNDIYGR